jgi:hypothetical protein
MRFLILITLLSAAIITQAQSPWVDWLQVRNPRADAPASAGQLFIARDMAQAPWETIYLTGFNGRADSALILRTYSENGNPGLGVKILPPAGESLDFVWGTSLTFSGADVFVSGLFEGSIEFAPGNVIRSRDGSRDAFLAAYSPSGLLRWARSLGDNFEERLPVIGITEDERLSLALRTADTLYRPIEIRTFDRLGNPLDSVKVEHAPAVSDLAFDGQGNLYLSGKLQYRSIIGGKEEVPFGNEDFYLCKYNADGSLAWLVHQGAEGEVGPTALEVGDDGTLYFAVSLGLGSAGGDSIALGDSVYITTGRNDIFITAVDTSGTPLWAKHIFRNDPGFSSAMQIKDIEQVNQKLFMTGSFMDGITVIGDTSIRTQKFDPVILKFNTAGDFHWAARGGTSNGDEGLRLTAINERIVFVAGVLNDLKDTLNASFGNIDFTVSRKFTPFLARLDDIYVPPVTSNGPELDGIWKLFPNPASDQLYLSWEAAASPVHAVSLFDIHGRRLRHYRPVPSLSGKLRVDLGGLPPSVYILKARSGTQVFVRELMKQ